MFSSIFSGDNPLAIVLKSKKSGSITVKIDPQRLGLPFCKVLICSQVLKSGGWFVRSRLEMCMTPDLKVFLLDKIAQQQDLKDADRLKAKIEKVPEGKLIMFRPFIPE